jgi:hypothetical protein
VRDLYATYRLMRVFPGIDHPSGVRRLPGRFASWAIQFDALERQVEAEREAKRWGQA